MTSNPGKRKLWFITRPQRDPTFHPEALQALDFVTDHFSAVWRKNRAIQKEYEQQISVDGIKLKSISKDGSGGRTWAAMLKTYGYIYEDANGRLRPTKVGKKILAGENVKQNITKQILTLQIPNAYFLSSGFRPKYEDGFKIRPARFLIRLTCQKELEYHITKEEITYFALSAKTDSSLQEVTENILRYRNALPAEQERIKQEIEKKFEHRDRADASARTYKEANEDVANTFMILCRYTELVHYEKDMPLFVKEDNIEHVRKVLDEYDAKYPFKDPDRYPTLDLLAQATGLDYNSFKLNSYDGKKPATNSSKKVLKAKRLLSRFACLETVSRDTIVRTLCEEFPEYEADKIATDIVADYSKEIDDAFATDYLSQTDNHEFENQTGKILEALGFQVVMRPEPVADVRTKIEILVFHGDNECTLFDAKNYHEKFSLSSTLKALMSSDYIPNYDGYGGRKVTGFGYIVSNDFGGVSNLKNITKDVKRIIPDRNIEGAIISARALLGLLDYCNLNNVPMNQRSEIVLCSLKNKGYKNYQEMLDECGFGLGADEERESVKAY